MKLKLITLSVAAALAAPSAFAIDKATLEGLGASGVDNLWISGASAPTASVFGAIRKLCVDNDANGSPDDLHVYMELAAATPGASAGGKVAAYACTLASSGRPTIIYHTFDVGSFEAYTPHLFLLEGSSANVVGTVKKLKDITLAANTCTGPTLVAGDLVYGNCGGISPVVTANTGLDHYPTLPVGGFSDTEYVLNQGNLGISTSLDAIGEEKASNIGQAFGLAASWKLYYDLQVDQFGAGACTTGFSAALPNLTEACKPSIPAWKYQQVVSVSSVGTKNASIFNKNWPVAPVAGQIPANSPLFIERRVGTSGTQSASNAYFLNQPCASGDPKGALSPAGSNLAATTTYNGGLVTVRSNASSGNVKTNVSSDSTYRLGVVSLENTVASTEKWAFVKLDGISPTDDTVGASVHSDNNSKNRVTSLNGDYRFWYELVGFVSNADSVNPGGEGLALIDGIINAWTDTSLTNLRGIFPTVQSGASGPTVSKFYKDGVNCRNPIRSGS